MMTDKSWITYSLLAALLTAVVNLIDRYVLTRLVSKAIVPLFILGFMGLIPGLGVFLVRGRIGLPGPQLLLAAAAGLAFLAMGYFYFRAAQVEEISRVVPLFYLSPVLVAFLAHYLLGERLGAGQLVGIALIIGGAVLLASRWPLRLSFGPAFGLMMLSAAALAAYSVATKYLLRWGDTWTVFAASRLGMFLGTVPLFFRNRRTFREGVAGRSGAKVVGLMAGNEALALVASFFLTVAASRGPISLVNALSSTQPFFVFLLGLGLTLAVPRLLREDVGLPTVVLKFVAMAVMFGGLILVVG